MSGSTAARKPDERRPAKKPRKKFNSISGPVTGGGLSQGCGGRMSVGGGMCSAGGTHSHLNGFGGCYGTGDEFHSPLRVRTSSLCSTGSSPPSSEGTPPITPGSVTPGVLNAAATRLPVQPTTPGGGSGNAGGLNQKFDFFADPVQAAAGNIFNQRMDMDVFKSLPRPKRNTYHIKVINDA